jgi:hypothetical protein
MSCRTTPAGSAATSFARISDGPGTPLSDVSTLSLFHALRREFQNDIVSSQTSHSYSSIVNSGAADWRQQLEAAVLSRRSGRYFDPATPREIYLEALNRAEAEILADTTLTEARKASLLARITAAKEADTPDIATIYAVQKIAEEARRARAAQVEFLSDYASAMGITREAALAKYRELENSIDRARDAATDGYFNEENRDAATSRGIVDEAGAVKAYTLMKREMNERILQEANESPRLIDRYNDLPSPSAAPGTPYEVMSWGQDSITGHTEFKLKNTETGEIETKSFRISNNIQSGMSGRHQAWSNGSIRNFTPGEYFAEQILNRGWYAYNSEAEAAAGGVARRCALCGQFASISHTCPDRFSGATRYVINARGFDNVRTSTQQVEYTALNARGEDITANFAVDLPLVNDYRRGFRETGMILLRNVSATADWRDRTNEYLGAGTRGYVRVAGDLALIRQEDGTIVANTDALTCSCFEYSTNGNSCRHTQAMADAAIKRATPPIRSVASRNLTDEQREQLAAERQAAREAILASDWTRNEETLAEARKLFAESSEVSYFDDYEAFSAVYAQAAAEKEANGKPSIPYLKENALGGLATRESGQGFGIEIEYDFPNDMGWSERAEAEKRIGEALKAANLTASAEKAGYHSAAQKGYKDVHVDEDGKGTWSWEHDGSVAGEIVTPTMYDEPETWEKLEKVVKILRDNGAIPSTRAGAHVHVGTGALFQQDPKKYEELARIYTQHEDVMFRIASDPERGTHRGLETRFNYASPNPSVAPSGFADSGAVRRWHGSRTRSLNFNSVYMDENSAKSHVEFRIFDSTLDAGAMQTQIKLAVAMTNAAARAAETGGTTRKKEPIGVHSERAKLRGRRRPTEEDAKEETSTVRSLLDTLFYRKADKEQAVKLFAGTEWVKLTKAQKNRFSS